MRRRSDLTAEEAIRRDPTLGERDKQMLLALLAGLRVLPDAPDKELRNALVHDNSGTIDFNLANERRNARAGQKTPREPSEGNIPLPDNWQELAAYSGPQSHREREEQWSDRGEESQEEDHD